MDEFYNLERLLANCTSKSSKGRFCLLVLAIGVSNFRIFLDLLRSVIDNESQHDLIICQYLIDLAKNKVDTEAAKVKEEMTLVIYRQMQKKQAMYAKLRKELNDESKTIEDS